MIQKASTLSNPLLIVFGIRAGLSLLLVLCKESYEAKKNNSWAEVSLSVTALDHCCGSGSVELSGLVGSRYGIIDPD
jgi:hypothetical protein